MFPEIPDIFPKNVAFPPKYRENVLHMPNIFLTFFYKYHDNDFVDWSETQFIGKTGMDWSLDEGGESPNSSASNKAMHLLNKTRGSPLQAANTAYLQIWPMWRVAKFVSK